jgi:hypothetical protein
LADTHDQRRHVLLGNGFSIGLEPKLAYKSLYGEAIADDLPLGDLFHRLGVTDGNFETSIARAKTETDRQHIREGLLSAIRKVHPSTRPAILGNCGAFLQNFVGTDRPDRGKIFTTNYDLLVYRALVACRDILDSPDGFEDPYWSPHTLEKARVYYLHGALHLFSHTIPPLAGSDKPATTRYTKLRATERQSLIPLIRELMARGEFPVFVAEGGSPEKVEAIRRSEYLRAVRRRLPKECRTPNTVMFTLGHSLGVVDEHIANTLGYSGLSALYVGCHKQADWDRIAELENVWAFNRAEGGRSPLPVFGFDSRECKVWGV